MRDPYDVIVVGGGAAGLSGALLLGRSRRSVLVIDAGGLAGAAINLDLILEESRDAVADRRAVAS